MQLVAKKAKNQRWLWLWWLVVITIAVCLKYGYSVADVAGLQWVFRPLALMLELLTGYGFQQDHNGEWVSYSADVRLVKACAGINFMIMSFLIYAWVFRPDTRVKADFFSNVIGQLLLMIAAVIAAWLTCIVANSVRIILAMEAASQNWALPLLGIDGNQLHRLIGMLIYIPLLSLQLALGECSISKSHFIKKYRNAIFIIPLLLYLVITVLIPLLTGNALKTPERFFEHVLLLFCIALFVLVALGLKKLFKRKRLI